MKGSYPLALVQLHCFPKRLTNIYLRLLCLWFILCMGVGQAQTLKRIALGFGNPSFEGSPSRDYPPSSWQACNYISTPDTQPIWPGNPQKASDGQTYLSMVCRAETEFFPFGSYEAVYQSLPLVPVGNGSPFYKQPIKPDSTYCFFIDLAFPGPNSGSSYQLSPALVRLWSEDTRGVCITRDLLWTSPVIDHTDWRTYKVTFKAPYYAFGIFFDCYFAKKPEYFGGVFLDNIHYTESAPLLGKDTVICQTRTYSLRPRFQGIDSGEFTYRWSDGSRRDSLVVSRPGRYWVEAFDGCVSYRDSVTVDFSECESVFFIPNVITPNADGKNDVFRFEGLAQTGWTLQVHNRWGETVYHQTDYAQDWDGLGQPAGIYYYRLEKPGFKPITGWVHLLR